MRLLFRLRSRGTPARTLSGFCWVSSKILLNPIEIMVRVCTDSEWNLLGFSRFLLIRFRNLAKICEDCLEFAGTVADSARVLPWFSWVSCCDSVGQAYDSVQIPLEFRFVLGFRSDSAGIWVEWQHPGTSETFGHFFIVTIVFCERRSVPIGKRRFLLGQEFPVEEGSLPLGAKLHFEKLEVIAWL